MFDTPSASRSSQRPRGSHSRGYYTASRGRGKQSPFNYQRYRQNHPPCDPAILKKDTGILLTTFTLEDVKRDANTVKKNEPVMTDFRNVTSYSWLSSTQPTILVPGCPMLYKPFKNLLEIQPDCGWSFLDRANALLPDCPMLPLFESVRFNEPQHDFDQYKLITGRGCLKKLVAWARGDSRREFRIDIQITPAGGLIFRRWEAENQEFRDDTIKSYRDGFEQATCVPVRGSEETFSHQRVFSYVLDGIPCLVQCEVDAFKPAGDAEDLEHVTSDAPKQTVDDLAALLDKSKISDSPERVKNGSGRPKEVRPGSNSAQTVNVLPYFGHAAEDSEIIELKTRSLYNKDSVSAADIYVQAVWSKTPTTLIAHHSRGVFTSTTEFKLEDLEVSDSQEMTDAKSAVLAVASVIRLVMKVAREKPQSSGRMCLIYNGPSSSTQDLQLFSGGRGAGRTEATAAA